MISLFSQLFGKVSGISVCVVYLIILYLSSIVVEMGDSSNNTVSGLDIGSPLLVFIGKKRVKVKCCGVGYGTVLA